MSEERLPKGWALAELSEIARVQSGGTPARSNTNYWNGEIPWVKISDIAALNVYETSERITVEGLNNSSAKLMPTGTILFTIFATIGRVGVLQIPATLNQAIAGITPSKNIDSKFLVYSLLKLSEEIQAHGKGVAQKNINQGILKATPIPLPPLGEQRRIVAKLDALMAKIDAVKARLDHIPTLLKNFRQQVLTDAVTGKLTQEWRGSVKTASWTSSTIGELEVLLTSGSRGWAQYYADQGAYFIRAQDIKNDVLDIQEAAFVNLPRSVEGRRTRVYRDDILITITGANVTKTARVPSSFELEAYVNQHVALLRLNKEISARYLHLYLTCESHGRSRLLSFAYGQGKPQLNLNNIRNVSIDLPPIPEQEEIIARVDLLFSIIENTEAHYLSLKLRVGQMPQALLAKAFRGELVEQDPSEESAEVLLGRLRHGR